MEPKFLLRAFSRSRYNSRFRSREISSVFWKEQKKPLTRRPRAEQEHFSGRMLLYADVMAIKNPRSDQLRGVVVGSPHHSPPSVAHGSDWRSVPGEVARWIPGTNRPCRAWTNVKSSYCWRQQYDPATSSFLPPVQVFPSLWSHFLTSLFECIRKKYHTKKEKTREDAFERATKKAQKVPGLSSCLW